MDHPSTRTLISYIHEDLPENQEAKIRQHLSTCGSCSAKVDQLAAEVERLRSRWANEVHRGRKCVPDDVLDGYLAGLLPTFDRRTLIVHIGRCQSCHDRLISRYSEPEHGSARETLPDGPGDLLSAPSPVGPAVRHVLRAAGEARQILESGLTLGLSTTAWELAPEMASAERFRRLCADVFGGRGLRNLSRSDFMVFLHDATLWRLWPKYEDRWQELVGDMPRLRSALEHLIYAQAPLAIRVASLCEPKGSFYFATFQRSDMTLISAILCAADWGAEQYVPVMRLRDKKRLYSYLSADTGGSWPKGSRADTFAVANNQLHAQLQALVPEVALPDQFVLTQICNLLLQFVPK